MNDEATPTGYVARDCNRCDGTGRRFDITNVGNATGTADATGQVACGCHNGRVYVSLASLELQARWDSERRQQLAEQEIGELPEWML